jgi:hypothetical protein
VELSLPTRPGFALWGSSNKASEAHLAQLSSWVVILVLCPVLAPMVLSLAMIPVPDGNVSPASLLAGLIAD